MEGSCRCFAAAGPFAGICITAGACTGMWCLGFLTVQRTLRCAMLALRSSGLAGAHIHGVPGACDMGAVHHCLAILGAACGFYSVVHRSVWRMAEAIALISNVTAQGRAPRSDGSCGPVNQQKWDINDGVDFYSSKSFCGGSAWGPPPADALFMEPAAWTFSAMFLHARGGASW